MIRRSFLISFFAVLAVLVLSPVASADTLCGRVALSANGRVILVKDLANLGTSGGYPVRKCYEIEDESGKWTKSLRGMEGQFACIPGYHHGERALTFVAVDGEDQ